MQKFVSRIFSSEMQRPSGAQAWQIPAPVVEPIPLPSREPRRSPPDDAQEASYFAASARIDNFSGRVR